MYEVHNFIMTELTANIQPADTDEEEECQSKLSGCEQYVPKRSLVDFDGDKICPKCCQVLTHPDFSSGYPTNYLVATVHTDEKENAKREPPYNRRTETTCTFSVHCNNKQSSYTAWQYCFAQKAKDSEYCQTHGSYRCTYCQMTLARCVCHEY